MVSFHKLVPLMQVQPTLLEKLEAYAAALAPTTGPFLESVAQIAHNLSDTQRKLQQRLSPLFNASSAQDPEEE